MGFHFWAPLLSLRCPDLPCFGCMLGTKEWTVVSAAGGIVCVSRGGAGIWHRASWGRCGRSLLGNVIVSGLTFLGRPFWLVVCDIMTSPPPRS